MIPKFLRRLDCLRIDILHNFSRNVQQYPVIKHSRQGGIKGHFLKFKTHNIRDFSQNKHRNTDDYPFGGGAGMVMLAQPIFDCIESVAAEAPEKPRCIVMSPRGRVLTPALAKELASEKRLLFLAGHYEGIDERVSELIDDEISIGDYVLTGGELPQWSLSTAFQGLFPVCSEAPNQPRRKAFPTGDCWNTLRVIHASRKFQGQRGSARAAERQPCRNSALAEAGSSQKNKTDASGPS